LNLGAKLSETLQSSYVYFFSFFLLFYTYVHAKVLFSFGTCLKDSVGAHLTVREGVRDLKSLVMVTGRSQDSLQARLPRLALHMAPSCLNPDKDEKN